MSAASPAPPVPPAPEAPADADPPAGPSNEHPQAANGSAVGAPPTILPPSSAAAKFSLLTKLLRRKNRVHNTVEAQEQNDFMQKYGVNSGVQGSEQAAEVSTEKNLFKRLKHHLETFTIDPTSDAFYRWTTVVTLAYLYNLLFVIARQVFTDLIGSTNIYLCNLEESISGGNLTRTTIVECNYTLLTNMKEMPTTRPYPDLGWSEWWLCRMIWIFCDILVDIIYWLDFYFNTRIGFLEQGLVVRDIDKIKKAYFATKQFKLDCFSMLPFDYIFGWPWTWPIKLEITFPVLRFCRLLRTYRVKDFLERTETRSSFPNAFRVMVVVWYIVIIIHWNACLYFWISETIGLGSDNWVYGHLNKQSLPEDVTDTLVRRYVYSFYWSTLILTTIGEVPSPVRNIEFVFVTMDLMCGVLIFATIVGNVGSMISNMSAARTEFQNKMDGIKQYMELRKVSKQLEIRVIKWFDYLWTNKQSLSDQQVLKVLPDKLQAEIAMQVHFETLRKVRIFQDCEAGLLAELVLKLQLQVFSPGDYICRKGDIGREMYIVKQGRLQVVGEDGVTIFTTLSEGAVFGELSILNISGSKNGNRRTANVRSVGYTDLFVLNKNDLWNALREYPEARTMLLRKGRDLLRKDNLLDENAPDEQKSVEEIAEQLNSAVRTLQTRMARLIAEHSSSESKLLNRIYTLETQLNKYKTVARRRKVMEGTSLDGGDLPTTSTKMESTNYPRLRHAKTLDSTQDPESEKLLKTS